MWNKEETLIAARKIYDRDGVVKIKVEKLETGGFALDMKGDDGADIETVIYDDKKSADEDGQTVMRVFKAMSHIDDIKAEVDALPEFERTSTPEEDDAKRGRIKDQQMQIATQLGKKAMGLRIFCFGCRRQLGLHYMFRCLYCGEYYCKLCAQLHFGERIPPDKL